MNYINCHGVMTPENLRQTIKFWSENSYQHIDSILSTYKINTQILSDNFKRELLRLKDVFTKINHECENIKNKNGIVLIASTFLNENKKFIQLLERLKCEGAGGFPLIFMNVYHYICEQRYINAILSKPDTDVNMLVSIRFEPFRNETMSCIYNHIYFWSVIGSMHPSLLLGIAPFESLVSQEAKQDLYEVRRRFNDIAYSLSDLKRPLHKNELYSLLEEFYSLNRNFLAMLTGILKCDSSIIQSTFIKALPEKFFNSVSHMIDEHLYAEKINDEFMGFFSKKN